MSRNPVFGFEKPYFENIKKELLPYVNEAYYDNFDNLILQKNTHKENAKAVVIAAYASENAFLVSDVADNGEIKAVSLSKSDDTIVNERVVIGNKLGFISKKDKDFAIDFGVDNKKSAEKIAKCGDTFYIKASLEALGNYFYTNEKAYALKNIITTLVKNEYPYNVTFVLFREKQKGAYALGKNIKADNAFFLTLTDEIKSEIAYLKKEKSYISEYATDKISAYVSDNILSYADAFYLAGGCVNACGVALKCSKLNSGTIKFSKKSVEMLKEFLETV